MKEGLNTNSKQEDIKKQIANLEQDKAEAEMSFEGEKAGDIEKQIQALQEEMKGLGENLPSAEVNPAEISQVENMGGEKEKLNEMTAGVDEKIAGKDEEIKNVEKVTEEKVEEVKAAPENKEENFDIKNRIKEMTGGSEKLERFGSGYSSAVNMYTASLDKPDQFAKYKEIFDQINSEDQEKARTGFLSNKFHDIVLKQEPSDDYVKKLEGTGQFSEDEIYSGKSKALIQAPSFDPQKMKTAFNTNNEGLFRLLQNGKSEMFKIFKEKEISEKNRISEIFDRKMQNVDWMQKEKLMKEKQKAFDNIENERKQKEANTESTYQKRIALLSN